MSHQILVYFTPQTTDLTERMSLQFGKKYLCAGCGDDIHQASLVRIQCTVSGLDLCPECFSSGVEVGQHKSYHGYK